MYRIFTRPILRAPKTLLTSLRPKLLSSATACVPLIHVSPVRTLTLQQGAIAGGAIAGWVSQYIGRRLTIIIFVCLIGAFIPLWILPTGFSALSAGAFCIQFGVQGAWGVVRLSFSPSLLLAHTNLTVPTLHENRFRSSWRRCPHPRSVRRSLELLISLET